jgi:hypothetical protein
MSSKKLKILHVLDSLNVGGMERVVINVANGLDPARFDQAVCCISRLGHSGASVNWPVTCATVRYGQRRRARVADAAGKSRKRHPP